MKCSKCSAAMVIGMVSLAGATATGQSSSTPLTSRPPGQTAPVRTASAQRGLLDRYCVPCHNARLKTAGLSLDAIDLEHIAAHTEVLEKVVRQLRAGMMPPLGRPRPDPAAYAGLVEWLETQLDVAAAERPAPGRTESMHRLNRAEYANAIRDLFGIEVDVTELFPPDDASYGFDNNAGVLRLSPTLLDQYLSAAEEISAIVTDNPALAPRSQLFRVADDLRQERHLDGLPLGTRGGTRIAFSVPVDGEYQMRVRLQRNPADVVTQFATRQPLEIAVDGVRVQTFVLPPAADPHSSELLIRSSNVINPSEQEKANLIRSPDADWQVRLPLKAGVRDITVAFLNASNALPETIRKPFLRPYGGSLTHHDTRLASYLREVEIVGPFMVVPPAADVSWNQVFACYPQAAGAERPCARQILSALARRAYRRPVTDADVGYLMASFDAGRAEGGFDRGIELALQRLLIAPEFLFRVERDDPRLAVHRVTDLELASRLSFFLWSSIPDDELLDLAARGRLKEPAMLKQQVRRMLADWRSEAFITNFAGQWLHLRNLPGALPLSALFPDFDDSLRQGFRRETELFFGSVVQEDRPVTELLTANYTFVNERLARHYGIPNVQGTRFRRVTLKDDQRRGLLGHGSVLTVTSLPTRTSPVKRGKWILETLLGTPPPPPPPDVPELPEGVTDEATPLTLRQRMEEHRKNPGCANCHQMMDPLGFALEKFDAVGRFRPVDASLLPIDASGVFPDGSPIDGAAGLRRVLLNHREQFVDTVITKLLTYALGRGVEHTDAPAVRAIRRAAAREDYRFQSIVMALVESVPFQMRRSATVSAGTTAALASGGGSR